MQPSALPRNRISEQDSTYGVSRPGLFATHPNYDQSLRKRPVEQHLFEMIEDGGPLLYDGGEDQQRSFDSTCRKFRRFLTATSR